MTAPVDPQPVDAQGPVERALDRAGDAAGVVDRALNRAADAAGLTPRVERNPYGMVAAALGVGYVLGGGLFTSTTARLIRLGLRLATVPVVRARLLEVAEQAVGSILDGEPPAAPPGPRGPGTS